MGGFSHLVWYVTRRESGPTFDLPLVSAALGGFALLFYGRRANGTKTKSADPNLKLLARMWKMYWGAAIAFVVFIMLAPILEGQDVVTVQLWLVVVAAAVAWSIGTLLFASASAFAAYVLWRI